MVETSVLQSVPFFQHLRGDALQALASIVNVRYLSQGEALFSPGDARDTFLVVLSGQVQVYTVLNGEVQTLAILDQNDFAVESALVNPTLRHEHSGAMLTAGELLQISGRDFAHLKETQPGVANAIYEAIIENLTSRLHHANNKIGAIFMTGKIASAYSDLEHVADLVLETLLNITHANNAVLALFRPLEDRIIMRKAKGFKSDQEVMNLNLTLGNDPIFGALYNSGTDILVSEDEFKAHKELHLPYASHTMLGAPLVAQNQVIGAILLGDKEGATSFSHNNRILLDIIARQIVLLVATAERGEL